MAGEESLDKGYFVQPTAFSAEDHMTIVREDIFGPVVACMLYKTIDEVIERANNSPYGLGSGLWTMNLKNPHIVAGKLKAGSVWANCYNLTNAAVPFAGYK